VSFFVLQRPDFAFRGAATDTDRLLERLLLLRILGGASPYDHSDRQTQANLVQNILLAMFKLSHLRHDIAEKHLLPWPLSTGSQTHELSTL
jgi:hypothetical protein